LLPRLYGVADSRETVSVPGRAGTTLPVRRYLLTDDFGQRAEHFSAPFVDSELGRVGFRSDTGCCRGLYPDSSGRAVLLLAGGNYWVFGPSGLPVEASYQGSLVKWAHNAAGDVTRVDASGRWIRFEYADGRIVRASDSRGRTVSYGYDARGNLISVLAPGRRLDYRYGSSGRLESALENRVERLRIVYDAAGRWTEQRGGAGEVIARQQAGQSSLTIASETGERVRNRYSAAGELVSVETEAGPAGNARAEWSADRRHLYLTDGGGVRRHYGFDEAGRIVGAEIDGEPFATYRYDLSGRRELVDYAGFQAVIEAGTDGRIRYSVYPRRSFKRPSGIEPLRIIDVPAADPSGVGSPRDGGTRAATVDAAGNPTSLAYDSAGRVRSVRITGGPEVVYTYDDRGRPTKVAETWR